MSAVVYSTLNASYLGSLSFRKRNWGQNVPKLFKNKTQDWLVAQPLLLCQLPSTLMFKIFTVITLLRFAVFSFFIRVHSVEFSMRESLSGLSFYKRGSGLTGSWTNPWIYIWSQKIFSASWKPKDFGVLFLLSCSYVCGSFCCLFVFRVFWFVSSNMTEGP